MFNPGSGWPGSPVQRFRLWRAPSSWGMAANLCSPGPLSHRPQRKMALGFPAGICAVLALCWLMLGSGAFFTERCRPRLPAVLVPGRRLPHCPYLYQED